MYPQHIHKKSFETNLENYQPISVLSNKSKVYEKTHSCTTISVFGI